jgi:hypothetical protein
MAIQETNYAKKHGCKTNFIESGILTRNFKKLLPQSKIPNVLIKLLVHGGLPSYRRSLRTLKEKTQLFKT